MEEGLPQSQVYALTSDSRGYLWLGTQGGGLSRFDGRDFVHYTTREGLPSNYVYAIFEDVQQQLWVAAGNTVAMLRGETLETLTLPSTDRVSCFWQATDSTLWLGTSRGIREIPVDGSESRPLALHPRLDTAYLTDFCAMGDTLWMGTTEGLYALDASTGSVVLTPGRTLNVQRVRADSSGTLWIATFGDGLFRLNTDGLQAAFPGDSQREQATDVFIDEQQRIWLSTQNAGVHIWSPADSSWTSLTEREGLPNNNVRMVRQDHWGNPWIATSGGGIARYLGRFFLHYDRQNGLPDERVYALARDSSGTVWASVGNAGLVRLDSTGNFQRFRGDSAYLRMKAKALHFDTQQRLWVGTEGGGLLMFDTSGYRILNRESGLPSDWIRAITEDAAGAIWIATYGSGLARITPADSLGFRVQRYARESGLRDLRIMDLVRAANGTLWYGTRYGEVGCLENGRLRQLFGRENGLPEAQIRSIAFDSLDRIWLGTAGAGLYYKSLHPDSLTFRPFAGQTELRSANPYLLVFDRQGNLWVGTERGVEKILFTEAGILREVQSYSRNEGFLGIETTLNAALCDPQGELWFGTLNGLTRHIPTERVEQTTRPILHFREVSLFYQSLRETEFSPWAAPDNGIRPGLYLPYNRNHLRFSFRAVDLQDPGAVRYRWRLEGIETDWSPLTDQQSVNYTNLPPGDYVFRVEATSDGQHFSEPLFAAFSIKQPWWQIWWVQLSGAILLAAVLALLIALRIRRIRRSEARKREELELKNRLLQLEGKALQLQMNPHFIFNALNSIQSLVATGDKQTARRELNHFAALMRAILSNSRKQTISLAEEVATLEKYLRMEQFCQSTPFTYKIELPTDLDPAEVEIPPMLLQPFVENAIIHGISHLSHAGELQIYFRAEDALLHCEISDNGVGRERAEALRQSRAPGHQSVAMQVTRERLEALLADSVTRPLTIEDRLDERGRVAGTRVRICLPLQRNF